MRLCKTAPSRRLLGTLSILSLTAAVTTGCKQKADAEQQAAPAPAAEQGEGSAPVNAAASPGATRGAHDAQFPTAIPAFAHDDKVFGHVVINDVSNLLAELGQAAPEIHKGKFDEAALRALAAMALEQRGVLAQNINLKAPMGCALLDFERYPEAPTACAVGYKDGAKGLIRDLGEAGKQADAKGHAAAYDLQGQTLFIDDMGTHAAVSVYETAFSEARDHLQRVVVERAKPPTANLEATLFVKDLAARYPEKLEPILKELDNNSTDTSETNMEMAAMVHPDDKAAQAALAKALQELQQTNNQSGKAIREALSTSSQATITLGVDGWGFHLAGALVPTEGSKMFAAAKLADGVASRDLASRAPAGSDLLVAAYQSPTAWREAMARENLDTLCKAWQAVTEAPDTAACTTMVEGYNTASEPTLTGQSVLFHAPIEGTLLGGAGVMLGAKSSRRELFTTYASKVSVEALLGANAAKSLEFKFQPSARTHDGVEIDRMTIALTETAKEKLKANSPNWKQVEKVFPLQAVIDRAELDGAVLLAGSNTGDTAFVDAAIDAARGKGATVDAATVATIFDHHPSAQTVVSMDPRAITNLLQTIQAIDPDAANDAQLNAFLKPPLSTDLTAIRGYGEMLPSATGGFQVLFDLGFLGDMGERIMKAQQTGGGAMAANPAAPPAPL